LEKPKVLVFDIETFPIVASVWGLKDQNIALSQIRQDWSVAAWGAKWLGKKEIFYRDTSCNNDVRYDKNILEAMWKLLDEADVVITQNGKGFDSKKLNARFIQHGMKPPSPYKHLDTYLIARGAADFTSNKLEYLTANLNKKYKKDGHKSFPGMSLWNECEKGNPKAWAEMKKYNILDVLSTEELYNTLKDWAPQTAPSIHHLCPARFAVSWGVRPFGGVLYKRMFCKKCKEYFKGAKCD
jgi:uncharacterized protein YprB with RNaseH-like and TPR domain